MRIFVSSSFNDEALIVPASGSKAVFDPFWAMVALSSEVDTMVFDGSISADSPVRFRVALAEVIARPNSAEKSSAEAVRYFGSFSSA